MSVVKGGCTISNTTLKGNVECGNEPWKDRMTKGLKESILMISRAIAIS